MKNLITILFIAVLYKPASTQISYFPPISGNTWDTTSANNLGWCTNKIDTLYKYLEANNSKAFLVLLDGKIVLEKYFGTFTKDSSWYWASAGKTLTSFLVGMAQQEQFLNLNDSSSKYLGSGWTSLSASQEGKITVRNQLTMTSGLDDGVTDADCTLPSCLIYKADAGNRWAYHNAPYTLLDKVIQNATGQTMNNYMNAKLKAKIGMSGLFLPLGYNNVFFSTPRSMARYGLLIANKGIWDGTTVMPDTAYFRQMINTSQTLNPSYGYLWWLNGKSSFMMPGLQVNFPGYLLPDGPSDLVCALGKNGQFLNISPSKKLVMVRMGDAPTSTLVPINMANDIWKLLNQIMCNPTGTSTYNFLPKFEVYPNPTTKEVNITSAIQEEFTVTLFDAMGKKVLVANNQKTLNLESLPAGAYQLFISASNHLSTHKLIKIEE